jgi:hypothetical protein
VTGIRELARGLQEQLVNAIISAELGVKGDGEHPALAHGHGMAVYLGEDLHSGAVLGDPRRAYEGAPQRCAAEPVYDEVGLEASGLSPESVALGEYVHQPEMAAVEHDHAGARSEYRDAALAERAQRPCELLALDADGHARRLAPRDHEPVEPAQLGARTHLAHIGAEAAQHARVRLEVSLQREDADREGARAVVSG